VQHGPEWRTSITIDFPKEPQTHLAVCLRDRLRSEPGDGPGLLDAYLLWLVLVDGHETGGAFSVMEQWMRQSSGPPTPSTSGSSLCAALKCIPPPRAPKLIPPRCPPNPPPWSATEVSATTIPPLPPPELSRTLLIQTIGAFSLPRR
jgi:hypothetical protein